MNLEGVVLLAAVTSRSQAYAQALEEYQQARIESNLFNRILTLAGPILQTILAG